MSYPKLVVVSNHCLSQTDANGRSLLNMLGEFDREQLYQIYSADDELSSMACIDYLQLTNKNAVRGMPGFGKIEEYAPRGCRSESGGTLKKSLKSSQTMLLRDLVWRYSFGMTRVIKKWCKQIAPDAVVLQLGDSANLIWVAMTVARCCKIPIIVYNTEDYYFKNYNYMKGQARSDIFFELFQRRFRRYVRRLFSEHKTLICNCEGLKKLFDEEFGLDCDVIYTASDMQYNDHAAQRCEGAISYCGNLGVGRHRSLIEIGEALQKIDRELRLEVYGRAPDGKIREELEQCEGILYHGVVPYGEVRRIIDGSRLLIHVEGFDPYTVMDTRYAFSTKLADYCCSGIPMLMYAPESGEGMTYIKSRELGFTASCKDELERELKRALFDTHARAHTVDNAVRAAREDHDMSKNGIKVYNIIREKIRP